MRTGTIPWLVVLLMASFVSIMAENSDPNGSGEHFVWSENAGWLNAEPLGNGGPGAQVDDFELTGWMWGENIGWVSLSCKNTASCQTTEYGVLNDGRGNLSGLAWAENAGWINFSPFAAGVSIDDTTGVFSGFAWAENLGWINFGSTPPEKAGGATYGLTTEWNCFPAPPVPTDTSAVTVIRDGTGCRLTWEVTVGASAYDVAIGSLDLLRATGGDYEASTSGCRRKVAATELALSAGQVPPDSWFLVRPANCGGEGSYDTTTLSQQGSRDPEIAAVCP